jgi:hypothetical protein
MGEKVKPNAQLKSASISKKVIYILFAIISVLTIIHLTLQYININILNEEFGPYYELTNRLDFDDESSIPTWFGQFLFIIIASLSGLIAILQNDKKARNIWVAISIIALIGSIDEVASIHENILQSIHLLFFDESASTFLANAWIVIVPFLLIGILLFIKKAIKTIPHRTLGLMLLSLIIFIIGSVFIDILTSVEGTMGRFFAQGILVSIEEVLEMLGLSLFIFALVEYIEVNHKEKTIKAFAALRQ